MAIFSKPIRLPDLIKAQRRPLVLAALVLLLLRSRLASLGKESIDAIASNLKGKETTKKLSPEENLKVLQKIYEEDPTDEDAKVLLVPYRDRVTKVPIKPISPEKLENDKSHFPLLPPSAQNKPNIDLSFLKQLRAILLRIVLPPSSWDGKGKSPLWRSKEVGILTLHSAFLVLRTVLSILVARLDGRIVRDLVKADGKGFLRGLGLWFVLAIPSTYTNSMIRHLQSILSLSLRTRLSRYVNDLYLSSYPDLRYYRVASDGASSENEDPNKPPGSALDGVEQYITSDVESWTTAIAGLYGNLLKPSLDMLLFTSQLSRSLGARGTVLLFLNYYGTVAILRAVTPAFGRLASVEAKLEGEYRRGMGRVGRESEEVAFYNGGYRERDILTKAYMRLIKHVNSIYKIRIAYEWTEDYVIKYLWSAAGYALIAVPILFTRTKRSLGIQTSPGDAAREKAGRDDAVAGRTETYISNRRLLLSLADAGGRMMYAYKDLLELAGLTTRIYTLVSTLHQLPPLETPEISLGQDVSRDADAIILQNVDVRVPGATEENGIQEMDLVSDLSLTIRPGEHLMITGSNGVGKTAVARVLAGLWPAFGDNAAIHRPLETFDEENSNGDGRPRQTLFVVPQRSYMVTGSLLENVIYPDTYNDFVKCGRSEDELQEILESVFLGYLKEREGGWATRKEWRDVLSGGEKQRLGLARVFWRRPRFAVLDECTSAVSSDVEGRMYESAKALGITLITISLRPSLIRYHNQLLTLVGEGTGRWTLSRIGTAEERLSIGKEIKVLEQKLSDVDAWEQRVKELERMLGPEQQWDGETTPENVDVDADDHEESASAASENGSEALAITESMLEE
ncbi:ATP-binding cassette transporter [Ephemerocybe angulata]|uniref:ATP-binding cassette transporter n=1 Tax=Ephemerocybe angulata TaxID=980116 RepID=A0A8H6HV20_9AGAR|nr:ATP-binding cassette transporter [Tulosesus angulatus]